MSFQKKNDPNGDYIRNWIPSLKKMPKKYIYEPWDAPKGSRKEDFLFSFFFFLIFFFFFFFFSQEFKNKVGCLLEKITLSQLLTIQSLAKKI